MSRGWFFHSTTAIFSKIFSSLHQQDFGLFFYSMALLFSSNYSKPDLRHGHNIGNLGSILAAHQLQFKFALANLTDNHLHRVLYSYFSGRDKREDLIVELNAILSALIPGFKNIKDHTMTDIAQQIEAQKRDLEAKLALISNNNLAALQQERRGYEAKIAEIDSKIQHKIGRAHV